MSVACLVHPTWRFIDASTGQVAPYRNGGANCCEVCRKHYFGKLFYKLLELIEAGKIGIATRTAGHAGGVSPAVAAGGKVRMLTLTWPDSDVKQAQKSWARFRALWWHKFGPSAFIKVGQIGEGGKFHYHVLIDRFIRQKLAASMWKQASRGRAYIVDVREIRNGDDSKKAASYVVGYISRSNDLPKGTRRYSVSQRLYKILRDIKPLVAGLSLREFRRFGWEFVSQEKTASTWQLFMSGASP